MLTAEENERLTRIGPGTPCGELFRRYWQPVAMLSELSDASPTKHVRVLGEDLVLFRDRCGRVGLLADHCAHRGASLLYGRVEERGIACAYHGWLYDIAGNCLETPAEPADSRFHLTVKQRAYPVRAQYGLFWAYMGPAPAPSLMKWDLGEAGPLTISGPQYFDCNWLQGMENHMDQSHVFILHQESASRGIEGLNTARGRIDFLDGLEYREVPFGIKRKQVHKSGYVDTDLMIFPNIQRTYDHIGIRVPIDDTHMLRYTVHVDLKLHAPLDGEPVGDGDKTIRFQPGWPRSKTPTDAIHPVARYAMNGVQPQDLMALETQGPIADRVTERLATSDRGIVLYREILKREIDKVARGLDPIGIVRDPDPAPIDTDLQTWLEMTRRFPPQRTRAPQPASR
ncbi:MAG TPA: Rieske 2Fe-2S domain-containing protein [Chloroflexota bacterium]|nr:Rieske 2Fe-2S domain-containing protein [Chloroflexota bacterium]